MIDDKKIEEAAQGAADLYEQDLPISVKKGTKIHNILEKLLPLKGVECFYGTAVWYKVPKSEFEKEEL